MNLRKTLRVFAKGYMVFGILVFFGLLCYDFYRDNPIGVLIDSVGLLLMARTLREHL